MMMMAMIMMNVGDGDVNSDVDDDVRDFFMTQGAHNSYY